MKKRLRKKKRIGEFRRYGFKVGFKFPDDLTTETRNSLFDRFIEKAIENNGLQFGGGGPASEWSGFVDSDKSHGSATNSHREAVTQWFIRESEISEYYVMPLIDAWHGEYDNSEIRWIKK